MTYTEAEEHIIKEFSERYKDHEVKVDSSLRRTGMLTFIFHELYYIMINLRAGVFQIGYFPDEPDRSNIIYTHKFSCKTDMKAWLESFSAEEYIKVLMYAKSENQKINSESDRIVAMNNIQTELDLLFL